MVTPIIMAMTYGYEDICEKLFRKSSECTVGDSLQTGREVTVCHN